mgnify:CR=1 FL=1
MKDHNSFFTATGIPSLFLIFSVLCLAVLSLLTLGNSRSELNTARNSMQQTEDYYNACSQASTVINEIQTELTDAYRQATDQKNYLALVGQFCKDHSELTFDEEKQTLLFAESLSDTQQLTVCLKVLYPEKSGDSLIQILQLENRHHGFLELRTPVSLFIKEALMNKEQTLEFLSKAADLHASDIFIIAGRPLSIKTDGRLSTYGDRLMPEQTSEILEAIYQMANNRDISRLHNTGDDDFSFLFQVCHVFVSMLTNSVVLWQQSYVLSLSSCRIPPSFLFPRMS